MENYTKGYEEGYKKCDCFWGTKPSSLVFELEKIINKNFENVLDVGCGEGKNAIFFARKGSRVTAVDISEDAIKNGIKKWDHKNIKWVIEDATTFKYPASHYDLVISYGITHCLETEKQIQTLIQKLKKTTKKDGYILFCAFNDRQQDLSAHPRFKPTLLEHQEYLDFFSDWVIIKATDKNLHEKHPHNNIPHMHSLTRVIAFKK